MSGFLCFLEETEEKTKPVQIAFFSRSSWDFLYFQKVKGKENFVHIFEL